MSRQSIVDPVISTNASETAVCAMSAGHGIVESSYFLCGLSPPFVDFSAPSRGRQRTTPTGSGIIENTKTEKADLFRQTPVYRLAHLWSKANLYPLPDPPHPRLFWCQWDLDYKTNSEFRIATKWP